VNFGAGWNNPGLKSVYGYMTVHARWGRWFGIACAFAVVLTLALAAYLSIQQHLLRRRVEHLLADVRQIQQGKGSEADVQKFIGRWKPWVTSNLPCAQGKCTVWVSIQDAPSIFLNSCEAKICAALPGPLRLLGWRRAYAMALIQIEDGAVARSSFSLFVTVSPPPLRQDGEGQGLEGIVSQSTFGFGPYDFRAQRLLHPEYWIGAPGGCEGCTKLITGFTPFADQSKIGELTGFDFSCITRWSQCGSLADLMPSAWKQYELELDGNQAREAALERCDVPLEFLGSTYGEIAVAEVNRREAPQKQRPTESILDLRIVQSLKGQVPWPLDTPLHVSAFDQGMGIPGWSSPDISAGSKYILIGSFGEAAPDGKVLVLDDCGVIPYSERNLAAIERGIDSSRRMQIANK